MARRSPPAFDPSALDLSRFAERSLESPPTPIALRVLYYEEISRSCALAGSSFSIAEVRGLLERDAVAPGRPLAEHELVAGYGDAAHAVSLAAPSRRRPFLALGELAGLHARAIRRSDGARPGRWRELRAPAFPSGLVPPPPWLVPREGAAFIERFASGPPAGIDRLLWVADAHARLRRIQPFDTANGRSVRLVTNLLLRRLGLPLFVVRRRDLDRYTTALGSADSGDARPLALVIAQSLRDAFAALSPDEPEAARSIASFATGAERAALYKAAQRGRLRTVRRGNGLLTTAAWIEAYRAMRSGTRSA